ncbi:MAG TPA: hypothetical protein VFZ69_09755, partial [Longimicrobiales bacterium]
MTAQAIRTLVRSTTAAIPLAALLACADAPEVDDTAPAPEAAAPAAPAESPSLVALRQYAAPFASVDAANAAGYTAQITPCWYHGQQGGQGIHIGRQEWIDGNVSELEPELVMYEPQADGSMQFVGVEYIVPFAAWTAAEPPSALGQSFMRNEQLELWVLHVWVGEDNPNGMFASWNPNVSCEHA